ncbi:MAG TPA: aminotransferase class IV [Gemmatimonadales bacterium]|nr:aminotransferase class IV [Gemmatimonadales bacterium]
MVTTVFFNGAFLPKDQVRISPDDRGFLFADGVYEVVRAYGGRFFEMDPHLRRLETGLCALSIPGVRVAELKEVFRQLLDRNGMASADATVYLQITRGAAPRVHAFPDPPVPPTVYAEAKPFKPRGDPAVGVSVITTPDIRWARCDIKTVALTANCLANQKAKEAAAIEAIFIKDGVAIEATASSFFAVVDGEVRTAPKSNYILPSISRQVVLDLCQDNAIPHREAPVFLDDVWRASELFLAGTTLEVMPVVKVDGRTIGDGKPGPTARTLHALFQAETRKSG